MKYENLFRANSHLSTLLQAIRREATHPIRIMEMCGGQTYALSRYRLEELLPDTVEMIHGPGCPVCVTPEETVTQAITLSRLPQVILCTFGDMARVPGRDGNLLQAKARGSNIRITYSPLDALRIASENPYCEVIFFAIGFETTTPLYTLLLNEIIDRGINNLSLLTSLFTLPTAITTLAQDSDCHLDALLAAGHVCSITGVEPYAQLARSLQLPIAVTGFEPVDLLYGIYRVIQLNVHNDYRVVNAYRRAVPYRGNPLAQQEVARYFRPCTATWRGLGEIPGSGLKLRPEYEQYEARNRFPCEVKADISPTSCPVGEIMKGKLSPNECPLFGNRCTPDTPLGAAMVSSEGACSAFYRYRTH